MHTPHTHEDRLPLASVEHDDFADDPAPTMPNREPYARSSQRETVRASLDRYLNTHAYDGEAGR